MSPPPRARRRRAYNETDDENSPDSHERSCGSDSDTEDIEINANMTATELYHVSLVCIIALPGVLIFSRQASRLLQSKVHEANEQVKKARRDLANITNTEQPGRPRKRKRTVRTRSDDEIEEVTQLARKFTVMKLLWLRDDRTTFRTVIDEQYDHLQRFENVASKIQGQLADIIESLPPKYAGFLGGDDAIWLSQVVSA